MKLEKNIVLDILDAQEKEKKRIFLPKEYSFYSFFYNNKKGVKGFAKKVCKITTDKL